MAAVSYATNGLKKIHGFKSFIKLTKEYRPHEIEDLNKPKANT